MNYIFADEYFSIFIFIYVFGLLLLILSYFMLYKFETFSIFALLLGFIFMCIFIYFLVSKGYFTTTTLEYIFNGIPKMKHESYRLIKHVI